MQAEQSGEAHQNLILKVRMAISGAKGATKKTAGLLRDRIPQRRDFGHLALGFSAVTAYGTTQAIAEEVMAHNLVGAVVRGALGFSASTLFLDYGLSNTGASSS